MTIQPTDLEVFNIGLLRHWKERLFCFKCSDWTQNRTTSHREHVGWYYSFFIPPYGKAVGPFTTREEALREAGAAWLIIHQPVLVDGARVLPRIRYMTEW